jgi:hypothetical protein
MNKTVFCIAMFLVGASLLSATGIAVISGQLGKATLRRANKSVKFANGSILESNDVLETGRKSGLGFKYADGLAALHLFSETQASLTAKAVLTGLNKEVELQKGSLYVKQQPGGGTLAVVFGKSQVSAEEASFLIRTDGGGKAWISVFSGTVKITNTNGAIATLGAQRSADLSARGQVKARPARNADLTTDELAVVNPRPEEDQRKITVPMADSQGRIKYVELVW